jgi:hypothetical protein
MRLQKLLTMTEAKPARKFDALKNFFIAHTVLATALAGSRPSKQMRAAQP